MDRRPLADEMLALEVVEYLMEGCQVFSRDLTYEYVNATTAARLGIPRDQLIGRALREVQPEVEETPLYEALLRCVELRKEQALEQEMRRADGSPGWFELRVVPVPSGACVLAVDRTARHRAQQSLAHIELQLRQAQKMEAVGRLAGGVAHDFNNMLTLILSYADFVLEKLTPESDVRADVAEIKNASQRASDLTRQLMAFCRQQPMRLADVNLNDEIKGTAGLFKRLLGANIETSIVLESTRLVRADRGHVQQILMNLAVNARDAMPSGGTLTIETRNVDLDERDAQEHVGLEPGPHVELRVSDTGSGMDEATQARAFEPFFTTKPAGKGTGLGLATVHGIVQQNGGSIELSSALGKGTTFKLCFPEAAGDEPQEAEAAPATPRRMMRPGTVLLVEDEESLRRLYAQMLGRFGHTTLIATSAADALAVEAGHLTDIDLLMTDFRMPSMNGAELARELVARRPQLKVLFLSAYTAEVALAWGARGGAEFLPKPVTPAVLDTAIQAMLGR